MTEKRVWSPSTAVVIAVGSELLTPHKTDTNSLFITERLNAVGINVVQKLVVGDEPAGLASSLRYGMGTGHVVIVTGGLGPTADDVTRDVVAALLGAPLQESSAIVEAIRSRFAARGLEMPEINRRQAAVPRGAEILANPRGTAPGLWLIAGEVRLALLPGPPRELRPMFDRLVKDRLAPAADGRCVQRRMIRTTGRTESHIDELARPIYEPLARREPPVETTILASLGQIDLHLATVGADPEAGGRALDAAVTELAGVLGNCVVSTDGRSLPKVVGELLQRRGARVAVAESCTGGLIASRLTDVPGSSAYLHAGWVLYSNEAKVMLGVAPGLIESHGAVSEPVAGAMAVAAREAAGVEFG
ncbi:MAG: CinA family nicotinamide mononucleotide deamidase-related protein, partial [Acidobacteria bacterium]|nr:CinA family nicotinamide mononucleotide deamidase-related protein [Acidobacteriota bacterium]